MSDILTIAEVARRSGVAASALRFYEQRGLIGSERTGAGHRRFPRAALRRVAFIVFAQKIGLSLDEIGAELAKLPHNRVPERADWARLSSRWTARVDERIAELQRLKEGLTGASAAAACRCSSAAWPTGTTGPAGRARAALLDRRRASPARGPGRLVSFMTSHTRRASWRRPSPRRGSADLDATTIDHTERAVLDWLGSAIAGSVSRRRRWRTRVARGFGTSSGVDDVRRRPGVGGGRGVRERGGVAHPRARRHPQDVDRPRRRADHLRGAGGCRARARVGRAIPDRGCRRLRSRRFESAKR